ncbi:hypothetical protein A3C91_05060 [Candidatus Azambacteria bacterium RIFCSPHIGHO2_02_FULL_52_12]|uniref:Uncharacterized protein n=1 Tax=Candidatus Azambacteria bacterium RIFCSPLOWO2_01_FULL_46_25 TaxID=1797298 RepID=A0A1F5BW01_9BACT|nr:MAG: hypothetical protein A3C91_05060 [Candidatus Azambacteria bacterium RIFCSPHIGHO2_02_FULL_52_12]OGD34758.1 MAG: hypothetical protein A2988_04670 [Candidatus Azambacteria bacterium RIFCSPLOWO2_01_FULL_46_25]OGD37883.1 MAG: hypothetical protein A2850_04745 [Candidatus Azambacteria bacterium RIFCSPHIGHO2_01_FULL_51_74]
MPNPQLIEYITQSIAQGASEKDIKAALLGAGWKESDVDEGLLAVFPGSAKKVVGAKSKALIVTMSVLAALLLAGGGFAYWYFVYEPKQQTVSSQSPQEQTLPIQKLTQEEQSQLSATTTESIQDILAKAQNIGFVQYEHKEINAFGGWENVTLPGTTKIWQKLPYMRMDSSGTTLEKTFLTRIIVRPEGVYFYDESRDKYSIAPSQNLFKSLEEIVKRILEKKTFKIVGKELIDGVPTTIIEDSTEGEGMGGNTLVTSKSWISNEQGIPLKIKTTYTSNSVITEAVVENTNFVFEDIPDSVFEVPQDKIWSSDATTTPPLLLNTTDARKRDSERIENAQSMATGFTLYASKQSPGVYPPETDIGCPAGWTINATAGIVGCPMLNTFQKSLPADSIANTYVYSNQGNDATYCLGVRTEIDWTGDPGEDDFKFICDSTRCGYTAGIPANSWTVIDCPEK